MNAYDVIKTKAQKPYAVTTVLKEKSAVDPDTKTGIYVRYTVLTAADDAPSKIKFYSEGLPATNTPSEQPPLSVLLTKK